MCSAYLAGDCCLPSLCCQFYCHDTRFIEFSKFRVGQCKQFFAAACSADVSTCLASEENVIVNTAPLSAGFQEHSSKATLSLCLIRLPCEAQRYQPVNCAAQMLCCQQQGPAALSTSVQENYTAKSINVCMHSAALCCLTPAVPQHLASV